MDNIIKKKRSKPQSRKYFTSDTEEAILNYNNTDDTTLKNKIYERHIHYPFFKLTQNIIHSFKFYHTEVNNLEHLQHEVIIFLLSKIHLFHHSRSLERKFDRVIVKKYNEKYNPGSFIEFTNNSVKVSKDQILEFIENLNVSKECKLELSKFTPPKAFSYFGTIAKRYLINSNINNYNKKVNNISIQDLVSSSTSDLDVISSSPNKDLAFINLSTDEDEDIYHSNPNDRLSNFIDLYIDYCTKNIYKLFPKKNDHQIADAILELFRKRENIDIFNKKALYIYIREMVEVKTPKITKISKSLYEIFKTKYYHYLEFGEFPKD